MTNIHDIEKIAAHSADAITMNANSSGLSVRMAETAIIAAVYFAAVKVGLLTAISPGNVTAVWPASGIALAAVILFGQRALVGVFLGAATAEIGIFWNGSSLVSAVYALAIVMVISTGSTIQAWLGAYLIRRFVGPGKLFDHFVNVSKFIGIAALAAVISASLGVTLLGISKYLEWPAYRIAWTTWWLGDFVGVIVVTPVILLWAAQPKMEWNRDRVMETLILLAGLFATVAVVFAEKGPLMTTRKPMAYLVVPFIIWAAIRLSQRDVMTINILLATQLIYFTVGGSGPFANFQFYESLLLLQGFVGVTTATALLLSTTITERRNAVIGLRESEEKYRALIEKLPAGIVVLDADTKIIISNPEARRLLGLTEEQLLGKPSSCQVWKLVHEDGSVMNPEEYPANQVISTGDVVSNMVIGIHRPDSAGVLWTINNAYPFKDTEGKIIMVIVSFIDVTQQIQAEEDKRRFYRETIKSATQGKLDLVSNEEIARYLESAAIRLEAGSAYEATVVRKEITDFFEANNLRGDRFELFRLAAGEAITNAIKHAGKCIIYAGLKNNGVLIAVSDYGTGISALTLPGATLRRGFSTRISMGMGYTIMLDAADEIKLSTGTQGTTVILILHRAAPREEASLDDIPDTWAAIQDVQ